MHKEVPNGINGIYIYTLALFFWNGGKKFKEMTAEKRKTIEENCQMLRKGCNRRKSGK